MHMAQSIYDYSFAKIYALYLQKVTKKGRTQDELDAVLSWLTGYDGATLHTSQLALKDFFAGAKLNPRVGKITGVVCGVRVENIEESLLQQIRYMDKVVDELAKGKVLSKIERR